MGRMRYELGSFSLQELDDLVESLETLEGKEIPSSKKLFVDVTPGPTTMKDQIARLVRAELNKRAIRAGDVESVEEANDFDIEDDGEPLSGYEIVDMVPEEPVGSSSDSDPTPEVISDSGGPPEKVTEESE